MSFTEKEKQNWLKAKRQRDMGEAFEGDTASGSNICLHCGNAFNDGDGTVTEDAAICDICNY
jgi:hypothetical protein